MLQLVSFFGIFPGSSSNSESKGILLVLATALVSGVSIFVNKFAVAEGNPFVFTFLKNAAVAVFLLSAIFLLTRLQSLKLLSKRQWAKLAVIGLIGGSAPFLLYFYALKLTSALNAGFIHKTMFLWVGVLAAVFLGERVGKKFIAGALLLLAGNYLLFSSMSAFGAADILVLAAVLLWSVEIVVSKRVLAELDGTTVAFGRMFFGSFFILGFLAFTGQLSQVGSVSFTQWEWIGVSSVFLLCYVGTFYNGLARIPASSAAAILLLGQPVTALLTVAFSGQPALTVAQAGGFVLLLAGVVAVVGVSSLVSALSGGLRAVRQRV
ncbi:MAG: DMT family transporter [Candidatus Micrarchaeota archaeon]